jgi:ubiquinone/menaquinone biosynthesis C-methylase UbiE
MKKPKFDIKELERAILYEKTKGTLDYEIARKYSVTFRYIEQVVAKSKPKTVTTLRTPLRIKTYYPMDFTEEQTTVWSFKGRGTWATHRGDYRGNWSPYIPRNIILKYSSPGDVVLDYFCGAGATAIESKLLGRRCIGFDVNERAIELTKRNLEFNISPKHYLFAEMGIEVNIYEPQLFVGDAREMKTMKNNSVHLICSHPIFSDVVHYTGTEEGDLSFFGIEKFLKEMSRVAKESYRVLKPGRYCAILIGDTRRKEHIIPLGFLTINEYLKAGFRLKELVIKRQYNCKTTGFWYDNSLKYNFLLLTHEYLPIFEKTRRKRRRGGSKQPDIVPNPEEKLVLKDEVKEMETTTVWVLPEKDFEKTLNRNVIDRYGMNQNYTYVYFGIGKKSEEKSGKARKDSLLYIKTDLETKYLSRPALDGFVLKLNKMIEKRLPYVTKGGFVVIETKDKRINGYMESPAKRIITTLTTDQLWLKEIILITVEGGEKIEPDSEYLTISHKYLLVYEVVV